MTLRLYRTQYGLARGEGDELLVLDLPHPDAGSLLRDDIGLARTAPVRRRLPLQAEETRLLPPVGTPGKVVLVGLNYRDHAEEAGLALPSSVMFGSIGGDMVVGAHSSIILPAEAPDHVDYEAELAVVIGKPGQDIPASQAWSHVAGLTVANDVSARDVQFAAMTGGALSDPSGILRSKSFPAFKPIGPALVTIEEFPQSLSLRVTTRVNGELRQDSNTRNMLFSVPEIIAAISASAPLEVGDVILTGTPAGVGFVSGTYLRPGDVVEVEIEGIGRLRNNVVSA
ncbi:fumarylacetoacetate hydrolase family protein [Streptomyces sp. ME02-8801-2C]|uniref:fumarylacetoacetate hydrolase family protein n=1 Tax=Streptomyces sp. ME02-8801-2C TaxID=3028680 RepID=UPI0029B998A2|nr:fumarylacetoacetate hydrolase family protein [Streptomyces sp. ME02-8801-2C]MDX3453318.1 fumarylacetoacetate hydrolase family protein [Streptomyces sp. ME02-8801-2C]